MTKEQFQAAYGSQWAAIVKEPAFFAALRLANSETLTRVNRLTDEQIEASGKVLLADLRGRLAHESFLIDLAVEAVGEIEFPRDDYAEPVPDDQRLPEPPEPQGDVSIMSGFAMPEPTQHKTKPKPCQKKHRQQRKR